MCFNLFLNLYLVQSSICIVLFGEARGHDSPLVTLERAPSSNYFWQQKGGRALQFHTHFKDTYNPSPPPAPHSHICFFWDSHHIMPGVKVIFPLKWIYLTWALEPQLCNKPWILCCSSSRWCWSAPSGGLWVRPAASAWRLHSIYLQTACGRLVCIFATREEEATRPTVFTKAWNQEVEHSLRFLFPLGRN